MFAQMINFASPYITNKRNIITAILSHKGPLFLKVGILNNASKYEYIK